MYSWIQTVRCTMALLKLWIFFVYLTTSTVSTVYPVNCNDRETVDTIIGEQCIIATWPLNGSNLAVNFTKGKGARLTGFIDGSIGKHATVQSGRLILKYNHSIMSASLMLATVSREDEGFYEIEESVYTTMPVPYENCTYACKTKYGRWILELNVLETGEVTQGETGKSMTMEFEVVSGVSTLFNYVTVSELLGEKGCSISTQSHLYGRLTCTIDTLRKIYRITIDNVTQRDSGLYKVSTKSEKSMRRFLNITEKPTCAVVGANMTIGWFYNQQGIQRMLMVIHSNQEVIMQLAPSNVPEIKSKFKHRLSYKGDVSRNFMMLSLLNVTRSDAGLYTLETLHGNTIPGSKQLNVEAVCTTTSSTMTNLPLSVPLHPYSVRSTFEPATELLSTRQEPMNTRYVSPTAHEMTEPTLALTKDAIGVLVVIPVTIVTLSMVVGCAIWIHHKRLSTLETDRPHSLEECDHELYITPIGGDINLPIPLMNDGHASDSKTAQSDSRRLILHTNQNMCMDGYETVDVSSNDVCERVCNNYEIVHETTESISKPVDDNFGYLTVLGVLETSV